MTTPQTSSHPLEKLMSTIIAAKPDLLAKGTTKIEAADRELHAACLLSFYGALYTVARKNILPTPLFDIHYDRTNKRVDLELLEGQAPAVRPNHVVVTALDMAFACHARDMPLIWEGETGAGKTLTMRTYLRMIAPKANSVLMSLSQHSFMDSPKAIFERSVMENGMPVPYLNQEKLRSILAMNIDELNLGNPNDLLPLSYGDVLLSREQGMVGIPIPAIEVRQQSGIEVRQQSEVKQQSSRAQTQIGISTATSTPAVTPTVTPAAATTAAPTVSPTATKATLLPENTLELTVTHDEHRLKRMHLTGQQNPPRSRDAQFSGAELTASMKNRFLILPFPKILKSVASTMWLVETGNNLHAEFRSEFARRLEQFVGSSFSGEHHKVDRAGEPGSLAGNPPGDELGKYGKKNESLLELENHWLDILAYTLDSTRTEKNMPKSSIEFGSMLLLLLSAEISDIYNTEKKAVEQLSANGLKNISPHFSLAYTFTDSNEVKQIREVLQSFEKPLTERDDSNLKSLADLVATIKAIKGAYTAGNTLENYLRTPSFITIEDVAASCILLSRNKQAKHDKDPKKIVDYALKEYISLLDDFAIKRRIAGYKQFEPTSNQHALRHFIYTTNTYDQAKDVESIIATMGEHLSELKGLANSEVKKMIVARTVADMAAMSLFLLENKIEIDAYLASGQKEFRKFVSALYERKEENPSFPDLYAHRLPSVIQG